MFNKHSNMFDTLTDVWCMTWMQMRKNSSVPERWCTFYISSQVNRPGTFCGFVVRHFLGNKRRLHVDDREIRLSDIRSNFGEVIVVCVISFSCVEANRAIKRNVAGKYDVHKVVVGVLKKEKKRRKNTEKQQTFLRGLLRALLDLGHAPDTGEYWTDEWWYRHRASNSKVLTFALDKPLMRMNVTSRQE